MPSWMFSSSGESFRSTLTASPAHCAILRCQRQRPLRPVDVGPVPRRIQRFTDNDIENATVKRQL